MHWLGSEQLPWPTIAPLYANFLFMRHGSNSNSLTCDHKSSDVSRPADKYLHRTAATLPELDPQCSGCTQSQRQHAQCTPLCKQPHTLHCVSHSGAFVQTRQQPLTCAAVVALPLLGTGAEVRGSAVASIGAAVATLSARCNAGFKRRYQDAIRVIPSLHAHGWHTHTHSHDSWS